MSATVRRGAAWETYFTTTSRLSTRIDRELKTACSLSPSEYNVLLQISRAGEKGIRPSTLAHEVVFSPSRLTHTLHRLGERGLLTREDCPTDARGGVIMLTDEGGRAFAEAAEVHRRLVRKLVLDGMTDEESKVFDGVFTRIARRLEGDVG